MSANLLPFAIGRRIEQVIALEDVGTLDQAGGNLRTAVVELAKDWRTDRMLRRLEALMIVAGSDGSYLLSGSGDVIEPTYGVIGIGSGGNYAVAAARGLIDHTDLPAKDIVECSLGIAADICVFTNRDIVVETLG